MTDGCSWPRRSATPASTLLREHFDVELGVGWTREQLADRIGDYDGILIRSATKLDAELLERADAPARGRPRRRRRRQRRRRRPRPSAGSSSPTRRSPTSITAAEHTMALLLALARNVPQAHAR